MKKIVAAILIVLFARPAFADSQGSATGGTRGTQSTLSGGTYNSAAPSLASGQQVGLQTDINGNLKVTGNNGSPVPVTPAVVTAGPATLTTSAANPAACSATSCLSINTQAASTLGIGVGSNTNIALLAECQDQDGNWTTQAIFPPGTSPTPITAITSGTTGSWTTGVGGYQKCEIRVTSAGATPTVSVALSAAQGTNLSALIAAVQGSIPAGTNNIGGVYEESDAANTIPVTGTGSGTCSSACGNTALFSVDTTGYLGVDIQVTSAGSASTITYQCSNDNSTWTACNGTAWGANGSAGAVTTTTVAGGWTFPSQGRYFRAEITTYGSGTLTATYTLRRTQSEAPIPITFNGSPTVSLGSSGNDPCASPGTTKSSAAISITSGTTTSLVAVSGSTTVYVCSFSATISQVVTTANTLQFEYGTGAACSSPTTLTGTYGAGGVTAGIPIVVKDGGAYTLFKSAASAGICAVTTIGASGSFQGVLTYVQQ